MKSLLKQIYRYTHPRAYRHNENLWPYVKIKRAHQGHISELSINGKPIPISDISALQGKFKGDLLLIASGPSVKETDFSTLTETPAMGVNGAISLQAGINFNFYVVIDMTFIDQRQSIIKEIISREDLYFFTTAHGILKIVNKFGHHKIKCNICLIEDACYRIYQPAISENKIKEQYQKSPDVMFDKNNECIAFNKDIRTGIFDSGTVAYWALQIIYYLGFQRVIIAGLDMNNFNQPRFYEASNDQLPSFLEEKLNSFIIPSFSLASCIFKEKNVSVVNLSKHSAIDSSIFKKLNTYDL
ncbi:sugar glycosyltransferase [Klebsiella sp. BIGb0407]|uniref:sugar glycosyltransferase n=1 Tax=Klebsiella sp. BIGb0407 TaxID=2940603 RepID=UPI00216862D8|nr:sugar glycosyltransferase [Klebsiella sp. BIGb0407]MCS3434146.1 Kdo-III transferase WaaZ [Klebsiella sp. BIGb0407]